MSCNNEHYYQVHTFMNDEELTSVWDTIERAMNRHGYDVSNAELSMKLYDDELEENIEYDMEEYLSSQSEGKDYDITLTTDDDYGSKVDALVDSMSVTDKEVTTTHRRKDMDLL